MILQLYDLNHNKIQGLDKAKDIAIESVLSTGDETLSFLYPLAEAADLVNEAYIRTTDQEYVIKDVDPDSSSGWVSIRAVLNVEALTGTIWPRFETVEQTITDCLLLALAGTGWTVAPTTVTKRRTIRKTESTTWDIIQQCRKTYRADIWFDATGKKIHIAERRGENKGVYFAADLNLKKLDISSTTNDYCTRIQAEGKDGMTFADINGGKKYVENYQYSDKVLTVYWKDERYTVMESLKEDAEAKLAEISKPVVAYGADIIDLASAKPDAYALLDYNIGDEITLVDSTTDTKDTQRIVKLTRYPDDPERNTCELANRLASFEDLQRDQTEINDTVSNITSDDGMVAESAIPWQQVETRIGTIIAGSIYAQDLYAVMARVGTLEATSATITDLIAINALIDNLQASKANIADLTAAIARISVAEIDVGNIKTLINGNLTSANIQAGGITSDSLTIRDGFITNAMILSLVADKITSGRINTNHVEVSSDNGQLLIKDNTIQIKDTTRPRVQIGKDGNGDYSMYVWDRSGNLMFDALGLKAAGIKDGIIRNDMVADNANIAGSKIDIVSLITTINGGTTKIDSTIVQMDPGGQTLKVAFNTMAETLGDTAAETATNTTAINVANGRIDTLIHDTTVVRDGETVKLKDAYNRTVAEVDGITTTIGNQQSAITGLQNMQIGGRNLYKTTRNFIDTNTWALNIGPGAQATRSAVDGLIKFDLQNANNTYVILTKTGCTIPKFETGKKYTISLCIKANIASFVDVSIKDSNGTNAAGSAGRFPISTDFKVVSGTFTATGGSSVLLYLDFRHSALTTHYIKWIKVEEGTKATDHTPAPEDVDTQITSLSSQQATFVQLLDQFSTTLTNVQQTVNTKADNSTVTNLSSQLSELTLDYNGFRTTVSETYATKSALQTVDGKFANYSTTTQMTSAINQKSDSILLSVQQSYTTKTEFNNLEIGGRNLYKTTRNFIDTNTWALNIGPGAQATRSAVDGLIKFDLQNANNTYVILTKTGCTIPKFETGKKYTISLCIKANIASFVDVSIKDSNGTNAAGSAGRFPISTDFKVVSGTFTATGGSSVLLYLDFRHSALTTHYIKWIKVEEGTKATDHTPAPEDTDAAITNVTTRVSEAELKLQPSQLTLDISSAINAGTATMATTKFTMDKNGLTVKNGGIKIQNNAGTDVLWADTSGNLVFSGTIRQTSTTTQNTGIEIKNGAIQMYAYQGGNIEAGRFIGYGGGGETGTNFRLASGGKWGCVNSGGYWLYKCHDDRSMTFDATSVRINGSVTNRYGNTYNTFVGTQDIWYLVLAGNPNWYIHADTNIGAVGIDLWRSDARLKDNITDTNISGIDTIRRLKHRQFDWKDGRRHTHIGYVAQELAEIDTNLVTEVGEGADKLLQPYTPTIMPTISKALQEVIVADDERDRRISFLENEVRNLKQQLQERRTA